MTTTPGTASRTDPAPREREERDERLVRDEEGRLWRVRELRFDDDSPSLIFESEISFRRVRAYPKSWRELADSDLYALSWRT